MRKILLLATTISAVFFLSCTADGIISGNGSGEVSIPDADAPTIPTPVVPNIPNGSGNATGACSAEDIMCQDGITETQCKQFAQYGAEWFEDELCEDL